MSLYGVNHNGNDFAQRNRFFLDADVESNQAKHIRACIFTTAMSKLLEMRVGNDFSQMDLRKVIADIGKNSFREEQELPFQNCAGRFLWSAFSADELNEWFMDQHSFFTALDVIFENKIKSYDNIDLLREAII